jgi:selenide,water dikinase
VLSDDLALVQTVDFFAPIVDHPYTFGQVAAANALSDVYAMGGEPLTAMNIVGFPSDRLPLEVLSEILRGGQDKVHEAGAFIVGGHTVIDEEVKYGLAVTGRVHPGRILTNAGARAGDRLVLTKPLGSGILATAAKRGALDASVERALIATMTTLNAAASRAALAAGSRCATDITGFGLLGHASHIARASNVTIRIEASSVPVMAGTREAWAAGARTGGADRNAEYLKPLVEWREIDEPTQAIFFDPQTSGGLLIAVAVANLAQLLAAVPNAVEIGEVVTRGTKTIVVH